jgi:hypothetical protein
MKNRALIIVFSLMIMLPASINGQVGNLLKNRLNKAINAGAKTSEKEVTNENDTSGTDQSDQVSQEETMAAFGSLFGNKVDLKYEEKYDFTSRIYMVTETYDNKDVVKMDFFMYYNSSRPIIGVETKTISKEGRNSEPVSAVMVMDGENESFIMLTDQSGMKMGVISAIPDEENGQALPGEKSEIKSIPPTFTKTGNTREIAGYKCAEYDYTDLEDKTTGKVWFTKDAKLKIDKRGWKNSGMAAFYGTEEFNEGVVLASETYDNKGNLTMKSETREINPNFQHSISVTGYTLRQMNLGQGEK